MENVVYKLYYKRIITSDMKNNYEVCKDINTVSLEKIKKIISDPKYKYISFDCFYTLVNIPFIEAEHIYHLMDKYYEKKIYTNVTFHKIRKEAEVAAKKEKLEKFSNEEISLDDIYEQLWKLYKLDRDLCNYLKKKEIDLLIEFSKTRNSIKEIYDLAIQLNKKIIVISDTVFKKNVIETILKSNGYSGIEAIFLSSEENFSKKSEKLYNIVLDRLKINNNNILHLGSDIYCDVEVPIKLGIKAIHVPSSIDLMKILILKTESNSMFELNSNIRSIGYCCSIALVANCYFDDPFRNFDLNTKYNSDPYLLGYFALGLHLLAVVFWIIKESSNYKRIVFMSRDGYLVKKAYDIVVKYKKKSQKLPVSEYLYISRQLMLPLIMSEYVDFINFPLLDVCKSTPKKILELLNFCTKETSKIERQAFFKNIQLNENECFCTKENYYIFISEFYHKLYDGEKHKKNKQLLKDYLKKFNCNDVTFDLGNYGRIQSAFSKALGYGIDALFLFANSNESIVESRKNNFCIKTFYDFYPKANRSFREYILSSSESSCVGVKMLNGVFSLIFESSDNKNHDMVVKKIHDGAIDFINNYCNTFATFIDDLNFWPMEMSKHFESFLSNPSSDLKIFNNSYFNGIFNKENILEHISKNANDNNISD